MKHTATLTTIAAAVLAAAIPLAAQAQTSSTLTISVGPELAIDPTITCVAPTDGTLVPVVSGNGELIRFTTDNNELGADEALQSATPDNTAAGVAGTRTSPSQPTLNVSWTRGSSTSNNKYIQIKAELPSDLQSKLNNTLLSGLSGGTAFSYTTIPAGTVNNTAPSTTNTASHAVLTGLNSLNGANVKQKYDSATSSIILSIAPSGATADNNFLPALASTTLSLDLTLVASGGPYRVKPLADGGPPLIFHGHAARLAQKLYDECI